MSGTVGVGIVGTGVISAQYLATLLRAPDLEVRRLADLDVARAAARAREYGIASSGTYADLLADDGVDVVVNLTVPQVHAEVSARALTSGRHVWSEKPLALTGPAGRELVDLAAARGVRLGCAPDTFLGTGLQSALRLVADGAIGTPRSALAHFQYGGPNLWHPDPEFLFAEGGGPLLDMGPYYLTALVQVLGPISRVSAHALAGTPTRTIAKGPRAGETFPVGVPTHVAALYEFADGGMADVVLSFDSPIRRAALEVNGTDGALRLPDPNRFDGDSEVFSTQGEARVVPPAAPGGPGRGTGVVDLVRGVREGTPTRASGDLALHVLDAMLATQRAAAAGEPVAVESRCARAALLPDGWDLARA